MAGKPRHRIAEDSPPVVVIVVELRTAGPARDGYERDDPETGAPLPPGVDGYSLGRR